MAVLYSHKSRKGHFYLTFVTLRLYVMTFIYILKVINKSMLTLKPSPTSETFPILIIQCVFNSSSQECTADNLELHSYGMLLPCGDRFRGVEYVCCPGRGSPSGKGDTEEREIPAAPQTFTSETSGKLTSV